MYLTFYTKADFLVGIWNWHIKRSTKPVCRAAPNFEASEGSRYWTSSEVYFQAFFSVLELTCNILYRWAKKNQSFLRSRNSPLEFYLHRSQYIRLLLSSHPPDPIAAVQYARDNFRPFYSDHEAEFRRLMACTAFLPLHNLQNSLYKDLADPTIHFDLEPLFAKEYCASLGMSRQVPLRVVGDIGGGGALARIEKGRKVMGDRKSEWNQMEELPVCLNSIFQVETLSQIICRLKFRLLLTIATIQYLLV